jgi:hypothetical protein
MAPVRGWAGVLAGAVGGRLRRYQTSQVEETRGEHPADGSKNSWLSLDVSRPRYSSGS